MSAFGWNHFPRRFGGGKRPYQVELEALLKALERGYDPARETESYAELYAQAIAIGMIWGANRRAKNQTIPRKMLESLPTWEEVLRTVPTREQSVQQRRAAVAAKLIGIASNTTAAIGAAMAAIGGANYVELRPPATADVWTYWPGINPGPPGLEWSSNRGGVAVVVTRSGIVDADFIAMIERMSQQLDLMAPSWMTWCIGEDTGSGFVCSVGTLNLTMLGP